MSEFVPGRKAKLLRALHEENVGKVVELVVKRDDPVGRFPNCWEVKMLDGPAKCTYRICGKQAESVIAMVPQRWLEPILEVSP